MSSIERVMSQCWNVIAGTSDGNVRSWAEISPESQSAILSAAESAMFGEPAEWEDNHAMDVNGGTVYAHHNAMTKRRITIGAQADEDSGGCVAITTIEARQIARRLIELADKLEVQP